MSTLNTSVTFRPFIAVMTVAAVLQAASPSSFAQAAKPSVYTENHPLARESRLKADEPSTGLPIQEPYRPPPDSPLGKVLPEIFFDGLPMAEVVNFLREKSGADILLGKGAESVMTPGNFLLHNVSAAEVLTTIASLAEPHLQVSFTDGKIATIKLAPRPDRAGEPETSIVTRVFSFRGIMLRDPRDMKKPSGFTQEDRDQKAAIDEAEFREFVERQLVEAINGAFKAQLAARDKAGLRAGHESDIPQISSHVATRLVIVSGDYRAVEVAAQVIDAMIGSNSPGAKARTAAAPVLLKPSP